MDEPRHVLLSERERIRDFFTSRGIGQVRVFGSVARGEDAARSDIDFLVELPDARSAGEELLTVLALTEELSQLLDLRVHVVSPGTLRDEVRAGAIAEAVPL
jgi:Predicted nucleotidyltransferases